MGHEKLGDGWGSLDGDWPLGWVVGRWLAGCDVIAHAPYVRRPHPTPTVNGGTKRQQWREDSDRAGPSTHKFFLKKFLFAVLGE
jgi:hypothetical protein